MVKRGRNPLTRVEGVSSPKRHRTEVLAAFVSQSVTFLSSTFCRRGGEGNFNRDLAVKAKKFLLLDQGYWRAQTSV